MNMQMIRATMLRPVHSAIAVFMVFSVGFLPAAGRADTTVFADGLAGPVKLDVTRRGTVLVSETGTGVHDGGLSAIDRYGNVEPLVTGLPSGIDVTGEPSGPTGVLAEDDHRIYLVIGDGDGTRFGPTGPPQMVPNPAGPSSPIFSSVLRLSFDRPIEHLTGGFALARADHDTLADGLTVVLENTSGEMLRVSLVADIYDFRPDAFTTVRNSNPFAIAPGDSPSSPIVVASGQNSLIQVRHTRPPRTLLRFAPVPNEPGTLPPVSEAVPTSIDRLFGDWYLVGLLSGIPFVPGHASVRLVDVEAGTEAPFITGLNSVTGVLMARSRIYVLEHSTNLLQGAPGRLLRFRTPESTPEVLDADLVGPSGMAYSRRDDAIFIAEIRTGQVKRVDLHRRR